MSANPLPLPGHEATDAAPRAVVAIAGALAALIGVSLVAGLCSFAGGTASREGAPAPESQFQNGPRDRPSTEASWEAYERDVQRHLGGYGWVDRKDGVVRIPLERAADLICAAPATDARSREAKAKP